MSENTTGKVAIVLLTIVPSLFLTVLLSSFNEIFYPYGFHVSIIEFAVIYSYLNRKVADVPLVVALVSISILLTLPTNSPCQYGCDNNRYIAVAKEVAGMISGAYHAYSVEHKKVNPNFSPKDLIPYMNYVKTDTETQYKGKSQAGNNSLQKCSRQLPCLLLHSGAIVQYDPNQRLNKKSDKSAIFFNLDPDGEKELGSASFYLYATGRLTTGGHKSPGTIISNNKLKSADIDPYYVQF